MAYPDTFLGFIGTFTITIRMMYYGGGVGYILMTILSFIAAYIVPKTADFGNNLRGCSQYSNMMSDLSQWVLYTNLIALFAALGFFYFEKGSTVSVISGFFLILNFLQMLVLFFYAQGKLFDSGIKDCRASVVDKNSTFVW